MCKLQLFLLISVTYLFSAIHAKEVEISQPYGWKNEIKKCASGGEDSNTYTFRIGDMNAVGLTFDEINSQTRIVALGQLSLYTKSEHQAKDDLVLSHYSEQGNYKEFIQEYGIEATLGWAKQRSRITLTVKFSNNGAIDFVNTVYAASWGAVSCAETKAYVAKINIKTNNNTKNNVKDDNQ